MLPGLAQLENWDLNNRFFLFFASRLALVSKPYSSNTKVGVFKSLPHNREEVWVIYQKSFTLAATLDADLRISL